MPSESVIRGRKFVKMHGARNHFVIVDARQDPFEFGQEDIVKICDVTVGVGADELVVMQPGGSASDVFMRVYNGDAREVEACGNATRCVAWLIMEEAGKETCEIETLAGVLQCRRAGNMRVHAEMGSVSTDWRVLPLSSEVDTLHLPIASGPLSDGVAVNVGNPHAVYFVDDLDSVDVPTEAVIIQSDKMFPNSVNVEVAQCLSANRLRVVVYERGAGRTMACGSGACAAAYAAIVRGVVPGPVVEIELPGGVLEIHVEGRQVSMAGPVAWSFEGRF